MHGCCLVGLHARARPLHAPCTTTPQSMHSRHMRLFTDHSPTRPGSRRGISVHWQCMRHSVRIAFRSAWSAQRPLLSTIMHYVLQQIGTSSRQQWPTALVAALTPRGRTRYHALCLLTDYPEFGQVLQILHGHALSQQNFKLQVGYMQRSMMETLHR